MNDSQQPVVADPTAVQEPVSAVDTTVASATVTETPAPVMNAETTTEVPAQVGPAPVDMSVVNNAPVTVTETPVMNNEPVVETTVPQGQPVQTTPTQ